MQKNCVSGPLFALMKAFNYTFFILFTEKLQKMESRYNGITNALRMGRAPIRAKQMKYILQDERLKKLERLRLLGRYDNSTFLDACSHIVAAQRRFQRRSSSSERNVEVDLSFNQPSLRERFTAMSFSPQRPPETQFQFPSAPAPPSTFQ